MYEHPKQRLPEIPESELSNPTPEVRNQCENLFETNNEIQEEELEVPVEQGTSTKYQPPPRSTKGIPPKRA